MTPHIRALRPPVNAQHRQTIRHLRGLRLPPGSIPPTRLSATCGTRSPYPHRPSELRQIPTNQPDRRFPMRAALSAIGRKRVASACAEVRPATTVTSTKLPPARDRRPHCCRSGRGIAMPVAEISERTGHPVSLLVFPSICFALWVSSLSATGRRHAVGCFLGFPPGLARKGVRRFGGRPTFCVGVSVG
jgi:hypothetical protein